MHPTHTNPTATSATDDHDQLPTSTPPLLPAPAPGMSERGHVHLTHTNPTATSATDDHGQLPMSTLPLSPAPDVSWLLASKTNDLFKNDQDQPMNDQDLFHIPRSPQPSAAPVGNDAHMRP